MTTVLIIIAIGILFVSAILERFSIATVLMILCGVYYHFWHESIFTLFAENWQHILPIFAGYMVLGVIWSFVKWIMFLYEFKRFRKKHLVDYRGDALNYRGDKTFKGVFLTDTPQASNFKADIIGWMCWWPLSIIGTLLNDPVKRLFHFLFETLSGSYQRLADKIVPKV